MSDISELTGRGLPSSSTLFMATGVALVVAIILLMIIVLPAEYGTDPTGLGTRMGLTAMSSPEDDGQQIDQVALNPAEAATATAPIAVLDAVWKKDTPFRTDEMSLTLRPNEGGEIKALMQPGDRLVFSWVAEGGAVNFDMHGEELGAGKDEFTSYWKGRNEENGNGAFQAPFAGTHGWYWRNRGSTAVTVRVRTSGYYERLFKP
jgi:hypothetical protein